MKKKKIFRISTSESKIIIKISMKIDSLWRKIYYLTKTGIITQKELMRYTYQWNTILYMNNIFISNFFIYFDEWQMPEYENCKRSDLSRTKRKHIISKALRKSSLNSHEIYFNSRTYFGLAFAKQSLIFDKCFIILNSFLFLDPRAVMALSNIHLDFNKLIETIFITHIIDK